MGDPAERICLVFEGTARPDPEARSPAAAGLGSHGANVAEQAWSVYSR